MTHLLFLEHHKVEMAYPLISILLHTFPERLFRDHLSNVFVDQRAAGCQLSIAS